MKKRALITGITGFAGSHMAEFLLKEGIEVYGICRWRSNRENISHLGEKLKLIEADILDAHSLESLMFEVRPDLVFHLAAQSFVPASWTSPAVTLETNVVGSANLFEAVRRTQIDPVISIACSSEEYGLVKPNEIPIKETNPLRPLSPYAVSKVAMDYLGFQYFKSYGMRIVRTRGFNHSGPRRGEVFAESSFAKQIAEIEKGKREPVIYVGNLEAQRDYTDVRDMVRGYFLAATKGEPGEVYNICQGKAWKIAEVLEYLLSLTKVKVKIKNDPARARPSDVPILIGDNSKFRRQTGWKPKIPLEKTFKDLLNFWRERV
ncbi:MAG: GDP-mannose 4,6-dehydratase [Patescibacteria group bacterium]